VVPFPKDPAGYEGPRQAEKAASNQAAAVAPAETNGSAKASLRPTSHADAAAGDAPEPAAAAAAAAAVAAAATATAASAAVHSPWTGSFAGGSVGGIRAAGASSAEARQPQLQPAHTFSTGGRALAEGAYSQSSSGTSGGCDTGSRSGSRSGGSDSSDSSDSSSDSSRALAAEIEAAEREEATRWLQLAARKSAPSAARGAPLDADAVRLLARALQVRLPPPPPLFGSYESQAHFDPPCANATP